VTESNRPYIVMPYHAAGSLAQRIRRVGPIAWPDALRIAVNMCGALETAHRAGTLHRDIKPANVLVNDYRRTAIERLRDRAHRRGIRNSDRGLHRHHRLHRAGSADRKSADERVRCVLHWRHGVRADRRDCRIRAPLRRRTSSRTTLRISSTPVPDMRPEGIPVDVCAAIKKAMSLDPANRARVREEFGHELQLATASQRVDTGFHGSQWQPRVNQDKSQHKR